MECSIYHRKSQVSDHVWSVLSSDFGIRDINSVCSQRAGYRQKLFTNSKAPSFSNACLCLLGLMPACASVSGSSAVVAQNHCLFPLRIESFVDWLACYSPNRPGWLGGKPQRSCCLHLPGAGITVPPHPASYVGARDQTQVLSLWGKCFIDWAIPRQILTSSHTEFERTLLRIHEWTSTGFCRQFHRFFSFFPFCNFWFSHTDHIRNANGKNGDHLRNEFG